MRFFRIQGNSAFRHRFLNKDNISVQVILVSTSSLNDTTRIGQRLNVEMIPKRNTTFRIDNTPHFLFSMFRELKNVSPFWFYLIQVIKYIWWSVERETKFSLKIEWPVTRICDWNKNALSHYDLGFEGLVEI